MAGPEQPQLPPTNVEIFDAIAEYRASYAALTYAQRRHMDARTVLVDVLHRAGIKDLHL